MHSIPVRLSFSFLVPLPEIDVFVDLPNLLSIDNHTIFVDMLFPHYFSFPQVHLKAYWLDDLLNILEHSPSILMLFCSQLILLMAYCRLDVNSLEDVICPVWFLFQAGIFYCPNGIAALIMPHYRGLTGCSGAPHLRPGS